MEPQDTTKACVRCRRDLPASAFNKLKKARDGLQAYCRDCQRASFAAYYDANTAYHRERTRAYKQAHPEETRAYQQVYGPIYYAANKQRLVKQGRRYRIANRDAIRAQKRAVYQRDRHIIIAKVKAHAHANPEMARARRRRWLARNRDWYYLNKARRRAPDILTGEPVDYNAIWQRDGGICHICGDLVLPVEVHFDHVIPLAKGGPHTAANLKVAHARCNLIKGATV